ncbi:MAG: SpoIID/LytB domain-containing protein [Clostridiaceae bacterium]|jgi:stage II sporulation protein D|nr:SpoIID/LytB domain-containing protein [Clostridiaceae bacterium]
MRRIFTLSLTVVLLFFLFPISNAFASQYPDIIRVGLNFRGSAVSSVSVNAEKGIEIGYSDGETFKLLLESSDNKSFIIRKDGYFVLTEQGQLVEYTPTEGVPYKGAVIGPIHLKIGADLPDFSAAQTFASAVKKSGMDAYVAYDGGWQIWSGFYHDLNTAEKALAEAKELLEIEDVSIIQDNRSRLVIYDSGFNVQMIYGGKDGFMQVWPKQDNDPYVFSANGRRYRGYLEIRRYPDSDLTLINILNLEQYLYGVVPAEIEADSPLEAIKAQAVAARTYTYRNLKKNDNWGFDLANTVEDQVYRGYDGERASTNRAVDETKGKKMLYNGSLAHVFYFASSGGMTADIKEVWGSEIPYLISVPDPYESETSPNYIWERTLTAEEIKSILFVSGVEIGDIVSVSAEEYSPSGRVTALRITGTKGAITYYNKDTRFIFNLNSQKYTIQSAGNAVVKAADGTLKTLALDGRAYVSSAGTGVLSSGRTFFAVIGSGDRIHKVSTSSGTYVFNGRGWGHGVGMSQEGAKGFARQGYNYEQILQHYFTGITVE